MFFVLMITLSADPLIQIPGVAGVYKKSIPPTLVKAPNLVQAETYANCLLTPNISAVPKPYNGGMLALYRGYKVFLANCVNFVATAADQLIALFNQHVNISQTSLVPPLLHHQPDNGGQTIVEQKYPIYKESRIIVKPPRYEGEQYEDRAHFQINPETLKRFIQENPDSIGLKKPPQQIHCRLIPEAIGGETAAVFEIKADEQELIIKQSLDNTKDGLGKTQFINFRNIPQRYGPAIKGFPIITGQIAIELALPIQLRRLDDTSFGQFAYLEVLKKAKGQPATEWIKGGNGKHKWGLLGKVLGMIHQKLGKFHPTGCLEEVPEIDFQLKNIWVDDLTAYGGRVTFTLIDLGSMGKQAKTTPQDIQSEIKAVWNNLSVGTPTQSELKAYSDEYKTFSESPQIRDEREMREHEYGLMLKTMMDLGLEIAVEKLKIDGAEIEIPPSRWARVVELYRDCRLPENSRNLLKDVILKLQTINKEQRLRIEDKQRRLLDEIIGQAGAEQTPRIDDQLMAIVKIQDKYIEEAQKAKELEEAVGKSAGNANAWSILLNGKDRVFQMPSMLQAGIEQDLMRAFMDIYPLVQKLVESGDVLPKQYNLFLRALSMVIATAATSKGAAEVAKSSMKKGVGLYLYPRDIFDRKLPGSHLGKAVLTDNRLIFPDLVMADSGRIPEISTMLLSHLDTIKIVVEGKSIDPMRAEKTDENLEKLRQVVEDIFMSTSRKLLPALQKLRLVLGQNWHGNKKYLIRLLNSPQNRCFNGSLDPLLESASEIELEIEAWNTLPIQSRVYKKIAGSTGVKYQRAFAQLIEKLEHLEQVAMNLGNNQDDVDKKYVNSVRNYFSILKFSHLELFPETTDLLRLEFLDNLEFQGKLSEGDILELIFWSQIVSPKSLRFIPQVMKAWQIL